MLYILIWFIVLGISIYLFKYSAGSLSILKPNLLSLTFYYSLLITCFIGTLLIVLDIDDFYMLKKLIHQEYRVIGFWIICFVMIFMPLSMAIVAKLIGFNAKVEFQNYLDKDIEPIHSGKKEFYWLFLGLAALSLLAIAYTILKTPQIPIFEILKGSSNSSQLRIEAGRHFGGNVLIRNIFAITLTPLLSLIAYIFSVLTNEFKWKILFLMLLPCAVFISVYDLAKSPIFFYILMFLIVRIMIGKTKLSWKKAFLIGASGIVALTLIYIFVANVKSMHTFVSYNSGPVGRLILSQIAPSFLHFDFYGHSLPFLHGRSFPSLLTGLFDVESVRSAREVMLRAFPERISEGTAGVLNTLFVGEAYANFGYLGVIIGTIYVGIYLQIIYIIFIRLPKNPILICLFVYFTVNIPRTIVGGFVDFLFNPIWLFIIILFGGMLIFLRLKQDFFLYWNTKRSNCNTKE
jgi:oligosaccharide repeat unit polymerase